MLVPDFPGIFASDLVLVPDFPGADSRILNPWKTPKGFLAPKRKVSYRLLVRCIYIDF